MELVLLGALVAGAALLFKVLQIWIQGHRSALSHVPGPWYTRYTSLGFIINALIPRAHVWVDDLHRKYGPVVRVTPTMVRIQYARTRLINH